ncbi:hypothetical protein GGD81_004602 [Rhodobium orientis]|uniref:Uncharacterized protein n=1 Tax=Rhodobium orientis TaxID=34017 RepID=A0A327JD51_9HYPH|nr:hypothetical protein [Rhodobium orientis]MBB4305522.1 hypothetical protein [Rhodobium orientis]MBK5949119.1 hypothetical protein [Rhodobium orientis]RAI23859.1 hypothetical protein CH339_23095 [Rhodobium orientis]
MEMIDAYQAGLLTQEGREAYARSLFDPAKVMLRIKQAAAIGRNEVRIFQEVPVSLAETIAARNLVAQLQHRGFTVAWEDAAHREKDGKRETGRFLQFRELLIGWNNADLC